MMQTLNLGGVLVMVRSGYQQSNFASTTRVSCGSGSESELAVDEQHTATARRYVTVFVNHVKKEIVRVSEIRPYFMPTG